MNKYRNAFLASTIVISLPWCFTLAMSLLEIGLRSLVISGSFVILWWSLWFYLGTGARAAFWFSFVLVNLYWWPLFLKVLNLIKNIGIQEPVCHSYPPIFSGHQALELIFLVPLTFAFVFGLLVIINSRKLPKSDE